MEVTTQTGGGRGLVPTDFESDLFDDEPRLPDWKLARALGFARDRDIHDLIERHRNTLERVGKLPYGAAVSGTRGPSGREYRLNFKQAIIIVTQSEAPNAIEVLIHVVTIYELWATGKLQPVDTDTADRVATATLEVQQQAPELLSALQEMLTAALTDTTTDIRGRLESVQRTALEIQDRLGYIVKRRDAPVISRDIYDTVISEYYLGLCPCCQRRDRVIIHDGKRAHLYCLDHWTDNPYKNAIHEMWAVCAICNGKFKREAGYRAEKTDAFRVFQHHVEEVRGRRLI